MLTRPGRASILVFLSLSSVSWAADSTLQRSARLLETGKTLEAEALLLSLVEKQPQNAEARQLLGDAYREEGNGLAAEREYNRAIALGRRDSDLLKSLATVEKWNRRFSKARASYRQELEAAPQDHEAREELEALRLQRGLSLFGAFGGWETDSTAKGWQSELSYRGSDRVDAFVGASYADKFFYTRQSVYGKAYAFFSPTGYIKVSFENQNYNYPVAKNPVPDSNAYRDLPSIGVEVSGNLRRNLRGSIGYEFFRPNFFFGPSDYANDHKLSAELSYATAWRPLQLRLMSAIFRDPDPNRTIVDKTNRKITVGYGTQYLIGGGADFTFRRFEAELCNRAQSPRSRYSGCRDPWAA